MIDRDRKFNTESIWGKPGKFFYDFLQDIESIGLEREICFIGCADGRYVLPAVVNDFKCVAIDLDNKSLFGNFGLKKRLELEKVQDYQTKIICGNFLDFLPVRPYPAVFVTAAIHYEINSGNSLESIFYHLNRFVAKGGLLFHEFIVKSDTQYSGERFFTIQEITEYYKDGWNILRTKEESFVDNPNPRNPNSHNMIWGTFYAMKL